MQAGIKLICFPFAGGNRYSYERFRQLAPKFMELVSLELPGHGARMTDDLLRDIDQMVDDLFNQVIRHVDGTYAFFGHSLGGILSYLVAKRLVEHKIYEMPLKLFVSGCAGPSVPRKEKKHTLSRQGFVEMIHEFGGTSEEVIDHHEFMELFIMILRADFEAIDNYVYKKSDPLDIPITVAIGSEEKITRSEAAQWQKETGRRIRVRQFPGNHFFIFDHPKAFVDMIAKDLYYQPVY